MTSIKCTDCGYEFPAEMQNEPERSPCPDCGALSRTYSAVLSSTIKVYDGIRYKVKDPSKTGKRKIKSEGFNTYSGSQKAPLVNHVRHIDRENNEYKEAVVNADTGEVIHSCEEPLKKHTGHGSAKKKT